MDWLRTPIMVAGIAIAIFGLFRYGRDLLDALRDCSPRCWRGSGSAGRRSGRRTMRTRHPEPPPRPFASFANPFDTGLDQQFTPNDLVIYSFEALEAWAYEHDLARSPHETPIEFVSRLGQARADLGPDATRLVGYFVGDRLRPARLPSGGPAAAPPVLAGAGGERRSRARRAGYGAVTSMMWTHFKSASMVTGEVVGKRQ